MLQGALVDKGDYANFASIVASYGFAIVVPNHFRTLTDPGTGVSFPGFFPQQEQVASVLAFMEAENESSTSPL